MLFSRRKPLSWREKMRVALWPRRSWSRSTAYVTKRVLRLTASPHSIAAGVAAGVFASFTPFMGLHFILAFVIAWLIAGNMIAAALGTFVGNPLTFPFIWAATYGTGRFILYGRDAVQEKASAFGQLANGASISEHGVMAFLDRLLALWDPLLKPMLIGGVPLGIACSVGFYLLTRWATVRFRQARLARLERLAIARQGAAGGAPAE